MNDYCEALFLSAIEINLYQLVVVWIGDIHYVKELHFRSVLFSLSFILLIHPDLGCNKIYWARSNCLVSYNKSSSVHSRIEHESRSASKYMDNLYFLPSPVMILSNATPLYLSSI